MLKIRVKIDQVGDLQTARYCAGMGVEFLGCSFNQYDLNRLTLEEYLEIKSWVAGPKWMGEVSETSVIASYKNQVDALEVSWENHFGQCHAHNVPIFYRFTPISFDHFQILYIRNPAAGYIVALSPTDLRVKDRKYLKAMADHKNVFFGGRFTKDDVQFFLENTNLKGLALRYSNEENLKEIAKILEYLEVEG